jgi:hypothetical protein
MKKIYHIGENIIEETKRWDVMGIKQKDSIYRIISMEGIFDNEGSLINRNVAITTIDTQKKEFWHMILDMMKKQGYLLNSSKALEKDLKEKIGSNINE